MTLGVTIEQLRAARSEQRAIIAAVAYDTVGIEAVVATGEQTGQPVIIQLGSSAFGHVDRDALIAAAKSLATNAATAVGVHLDHSRDLEEIRYCLDAGYSSVMIDGSQSDFGENIALTRQAVEVARPYAAWVEAELGHIAGNEDRSTGAVSGAMTDPAEARMFVEETGVDVLAVCVGNVHGRTPGPVVLDLDLLADIASAVSIPLVLHGGSGIPADTIRQTVQSGVAKINVNADLRAAYLTATEAHRADDASGDDLPGALVAARSALTARLVALVEQHS